MKIKVKKRYHDKQLDLIKEPGDVYEVSEERAKEISELGYAEILPVDKPKRKKKN